VLVTDREGGEYSNQVLSLDGVFRLTETDSVQLQVVGSRTRYPDEVAADFGQPSGWFSDRVISFEYDHVARNAGWWLDYEEAGDDFRADLGFEPMVGYRNVEGGASYTWIAEAGKWWSTVRIGNEFNYFEDADGELLYENGSLWLSYSGTMQSWVFVRGDRSRRAYNEEVFDLTSYTASAGFRPLAELETDLSISFGDRVDYANTRRGQRLRVAPSVSWDLGRHVHLGLHHVFERMEVGGSRLYVANITDSTLVYQLNRRIFARVILQFVDYEFNPDLYLEPREPVFRHLFSQLLLSYKINPQTVLFVGYSDSSYGSLDISLTRADRTLFVKVGYAWLP
jgi:hypothetical protein